MSPFLVPAFTAPVALIVSYANNRVAHRRDLTPERYAEIQPSANLLTAAVILPLNFIMLTVLACVFWFSAKRIQTPVGSSIVAAYWIARWGVSQHGEKLPWIGQRLKPILLHNRRAAGLARIEPQPPQIHLDKI